MHSFNRKSTNDFPEMNFYDMLLMSYIMKTNHLIHMKYKILATIFILATLLSCSGRYYYKILSSEPHKAQLQKYENIHLGWLPIDENDWKKYNYESKAAWVDVIRTLNINGLQKWSLEILPKKKITGATSNADKVIPRQTDLFVRFNSINIENYGRSGIIDVDFIDVKTHAIVYKASAKIYIKGVNYFTLEDTASALMYYTASFLYYQLTD